jgi:hypothetical protein
MRRRQAILIGLACGLVAFVGILGAARAARHHTAPVVVDIQDDSASCGIPPGFDVIGTAAFTRKGATVTVKVRLTAGDSHTTYTETLYDADTCNPIATMGSFRTNRAGHGAHTFKAQVGAQVNFYVNNYDGDDENDSAVAALPG